MRLLLALIVSILAALPLPATELDVKLVAALANESLRRWQVPGAVVAVVHGDREFVLGCGTTEWKGTVPLTANATVPLASCTKALTVALLAQLVDEGKLDWDDPVRKHVPEFRVSDPRVDALVTLRDLVSHRSGIKGHDLLWYRAPWDRDEVVRRIAKLPVERTFRGSYEYSTILFMVAGKAAENATGKPWADLVRERVTGPLGMKSATVSTADPNFRRADVPNGHRIDKDGRPVAVPLYETREPNAAGSIHLAARDLIPWLRFQLGDGSMAGKRLVSEKQFLEMRRPLNPLPMDAALRRLNPDTVQMSYAMGWFVYDYRGIAVLAHGGLIDGFRVLVTVVPKHRLGIAIVSTVQETKMNQALTNSLIDRASDSPAKDWDATLLDAVRIDAKERAESWEATKSTRRANVPPSVALKEFAGTYSEPAYGTATVDAKDGKLVWKWSSFAVELDHWEGDVFRFPSGLLEDRLIGFRVGKDGPEAFQFEGQTFVRDKR